MSTRIVKLPVRTVTGPSILRVHVAEAGDRRVVFSIQQAADQSAPNPIDMRAADAQRLAIALLNAALEIGL